MRWPLPTIDFAGEMHHVSDCNPNSLYPYASLHRTKEFSEPRPTRLLSAVLTRAHSCSGGTLAVIETADRIRRRCAYGNRQDRRLRGARGGLAETPDDNSDSDRQTARRRFAQETADCDSASHRRFPNRYKLAAIQRREVKSSDGRREIGREYAPAHAAGFDRFRCGCSNSRGFNEISFSL